MSTSRAFANKLSSNTPNSRQGGQNCRDNTLNLDYWAFLWANKLDEWREDDGNKLMWEYMNGVFLKMMKKRPSNTRISVAMCGKAKDMKMMYDYGFTVVGVECVQQAIDEFFIENHIPRKEYPQDVRPSKFPYVMSEDGRIILIQADILKCAPHDLPFTSYDIIWDRGAFNSINFSERERYAKLEADLLAPDGKLLLIAYEYDPEVFGGPPAHTSRNCLIRCFGSCPSISEVNRDNVMHPDNPKRDMMLKRGLPSIMYEVLYLMTKNE